MSEVNSLSRYYAKSDKPICPYCGAELPKLKEGGKNNE